MSKAKNERIVTKVESRDRETVTRTDYVVDSGDEQPDLPPALSEHEWAQWRAHRLNPVTMRVEASGFPTPPANLVKVIALTNDQLHDEDPRKLTRGDAAMLRRAAEVIGAIASDDEAAKFANGELFSQLHEHADVIESYLESGPAVA